MTHGPRTLLVALGCVLFAACEPTYGNLGEVLDPSEVFLGASETYMTGDSSAATMITFSEQDETGTGSIAYGRVEQNGETTLLTGTYRAPEETLIRATFDIIYTFPYEYDMPAARRNGSSTTVLEEPIVYSGSIMGDAETVSIETEEGEQVLTRVGLLLPNIDPTTPEGELLLARTLNYALLTSLSRVIGFGSAGLTMYLNRVGTFQGLQTGRQEVTFRELFSPKANFTYVEYTDLTGFRFDGQYESRTDISATGDMIGSVDFALTTDRESPPLLSGTLVYENVLINGGVPDDGFYRVNLDDGPSFDVPSTDFHTIDLALLFE